MIGDLKLRNLSASLENGSFPLPPFVFLNYFNRFDNFYPSVGYSLFGIRYPFHPIRYKLFVIRYHSCPKYDSHRKDAENAKRLFFYLAVRGRQIKSPLKCRERHFFTTIAIEKAISICSQRDEFCDPIASHDWITA